MKLLNVLVISIILICAMITPVLAQEETLLKNDFESSGYGGPVIRGTQINGNTGILVGGYGGWLINHCFLIGGGGCGLVDKIEAPDSVQEPDNELYLNLGYGGLVLEIMDDRSSKLIHFTISTLIGAGGIGYSGELISNQDYNSAFFICEPALNLELNVTHYFRIDAGLSYRYISGVKLAGISDKDLSGVTLGLAFKFGAF